MPVSKVNMGFASIALFFAYIYGLGLAATGFFKNSENFIERNVMRLGIGLAVFPFAGIVLNALGIPIDWRIFLALSLAAPAFFAFRNFSSFRFSFSLKKSDLYALAAVVLGLSVLYVFATGSLSYPYLEDEDPWGHAAGAKYISVEKKAFDPPAYNFAYIDPYPPGYDILMGVLHQTSPSISWTIKFFNSLIIGLGIVFFYFVAKSLMNSRGKALFATFVLASLPSYLSHFIWAHSLVVTLFFPAMYSLMMVRIDKRWAAVFALCVAGLLTTQPDQPLKMSVFMGSFLLIRFAYDRKLPLYELAGGLAGVLLSLVWWAAKAGQMFSYATGIEIGGSAFSPEGGSATRAYTFADFFYAKSVNLINNPVGWGVVVSLLLAVGVLALLLHYRKALKREGYWIPVLLFWFVFTFLGTNSVTFDLPIGLKAFRFWMLLAIPVSLLAAEGAWFLRGLARSASLPSFLVLALLAAGVFATSAVPKYTINTSSWYWGPFTQEEMSGYVQLRGLPPNTPVFTFADDSFVIGMDKYICAWCPEVVEFKKRGFNASADETLQWLRSNRYNYLILGTKDAELFGFNETNAKINSIASKVKPVFGNSALVIFRV